MSTVCCSQCGRAVPTERDDLRGWKHGDLVLSGELDDVSATMLLCPECVEEDRSGEFDTGEPG